jgi:drug/metabolite transporter (DMT)-like permease
MKYKFYKENPNTLKYFSYILGGLATILMFAGGIGPGIGIFAGLGSAFCFVSAKRIEKTG